MPENNNILEKLEGLESRFEEVSTLITDPEVIADQQRFVKLTKEYKDLSDIMDARKRYISCLNSIKEAKDIMANESDADMREMAREELAENEALQRELQAIYMGGQQRINAEQQNVVSQLLDLTQRLVNNYRKANGLSVVLGTDVAVAYDPALDVTNALLDEMNKQKVNFVSVSNPQPEAPAAAEAPAAEAPAKAAQDTKAAEKPAEKPAPAAEKPAAEKAAPAEAKAK